MENLTSGVIYGGDWRGKGRGNIAKYTRGAIFIDKFARSRSDYEKERKLELKIEKDKQRKEKALNKLKS